MLKSKNSLTWKEYKNTRLTAKEKQELLQSPDLALIVLNGKQNPYNNSVFRSLVNKLTADAKDYLIEAVLEMIVSLDSVSIIKRKEK